MIPMPRTMDRPERNDRILNWVIWFAFTSSMILLFLLVTAFSAHAQWPTSPHAPLVICNDASTQRDLRVVADDAGGWYVLWTDDRTTSLRFAVYGQRVDAQGNLLWEPNGRLIQEVPGRSINYLTASRMNNGRLLLAYSSGADHVSGDTLRAQTYDGEGVPQWAGPTLLACPGLLPDGSTSGGNNWPRSVVTDEGVFIGWDCQVIGATAYAYITRVREDGSTAIPEQGVPVSALNNPFLGGPWAMRSDRAGGLLLEKRMGNGAGAPLRAMRVGSMGEPLWPEHLLVSANSNGLYYEWSTAVAPTGQVNSVWANSYDLRMAIYDTTGVLFNATAPIDVCVQPDVQENPFVVQSADATTVYWADNRGGNGRQVYMQRYDVDDAPEFTENGVLAMQANGNLNGFPRAIAAENDTHILTLFTSADLQGGTPGFRAGRVTSTGTNLWSDTTRFSVPNLGPSGGTDYALVSDGDGGAAAFWFNWENNAIYAARLDRDGRMGDFTGIDERAAVHFEVYPNPATDRLTLAAAVPLEHVMVHACDGRTIAVPVSRRDAGLVLDIAGLASGTYILSVQHSTGRTAQRFIKQ